MANHLRSLTVGSFPYRPGFNPYQRLFTQALESADITVRRIAPKKWFPLTRACHEPVDLLHLDWHHDWYRGKNRLTEWLKSVMYWHGLRSCRRLPIVWTAHNLASHDSQNLDRDRHYTQQLINVCDGIMVMSATSEALLRSEYSVPEATIVETVHHGHYIDCYPNEVSAQTARKHLGIDDDAFIFLTLGALKPYKGHTELVHAFEAIASSKDRLIIAGSASDQNYCMKLQTTITDAQQRRPELEIDLYAKTIADDEMQLYFQAANVCVLPFQRIHNSGSLLLAMSFGKPVVAPCLGSISEIAHAESFVGFNAKDQLALSKAMATARNRFHANSISSEIIEFTRDTYDWGLAGNKLRRLYKKLL